MRKDREAQRESKRGRGEERDGEQEFPIEIFCWLWLQGGYYANVGGQTVGGGEEKERRRTREAKREQWLYTRII